MCYTSDNHNYMCHTRAKEFFKIRAVIKQLLTKYQFFHDIAPNFTFSPNIVIFQVFLQLFRPTRQLNARVS